MAAALKDGDRAMLRGVAGAIRDQVDKLAGAVLPKMREIETRTLLQAKEIEALRAALEELAERNLADAYKGTHQAGVAYQRGALCTHQGGLWLCLASTSERPGSTDAWRLIVKRGATA
jgi:hypothetical protein